MRFDWYQATIADHPVTVAETLRERFGGDHAIMEGRGMHGYRQRFNVCNGAGDVVASVLAGGKNGDPNAWASGDDTDAFVEVVRGVWPDSHRVTRLDAAEDFQRGDAYDVLRKSVRTAARESRVKCREILPDEDPTEGRTYYAGAASSSVRARLYEKGKQLRAKASELHRVLIPEDWVRLEVQVRPEGSSRIAAAHIEPAHAWGFSGWTAEVARLALELDVPRVSIRPWRESDDDRAYRFLLRQYGQLLERRMLDHGSWSALGEQIGYDLTHPRH